jgi:uncharacterized protein (DUF305 family)
MSDAEELRPAGTTRLRRILGAIIVVALLVVAGTVGWLVRGGGGSSVPSAGSVDAGFAQDMTTHHIQAVTMAGYERDNTTNSGLKVLAFDIETSQQFQVGQMSGWLDAWGLGRNNAHPMAWMGSAHHMAGMTAGSLMPGMATPAQMSKLESLHGRALDVLFLQLMIRHHQGGLPMARYAEAHASEPYVRTLAGAIVSAQSSEIVEMEQLLRGLGGTPLPAPTGS